MVNNMKQITTIKKGTDTEIFYKDILIGYFHKITSQYGEGKIGNYFVYHDNEDDFSPAACLFLMYALPFGQSSS